MKKINIKSSLIFIILILSIVPALIPFFNSGFIVTDDGSWMIIRLSAFYDTIRDGQIPARFIERLNFGYGYPVANFLYPGYLYLGSVIHFIGFGFIDSVKILFGLSLVFSGVFSFIWLRRLFGNVDSLLGALVYIYSPYHLFDIFKRGSLGEALSISVLPLTFYGIEKGSTVIIALCVFSILLFHNTLAIFFLPLIPLYSILRKSLARSLPGIILGGAMSSFFTIPAIFELKYTKFSETEISNYAEYFADINLVGVLAIVLFISALVLPFVIYREELHKIPYRNLLLFFSLIFLISVFLATSFSGFVWNAVGSSFVQFPYRFLSITLIIASFFSAFISYILFSKVKVVAFIIIILLLALFGFRYITEVEYSNYPDEYYSTNEATTTIHDEYMPIWVKQKPSSRPAEKIEVISGDASISNISELSNKIEFETVVNSDSVIRVNTLYYPGWRVFVEGSQREINYDNEYGVIEFELEQYDDRVYISFQDDLMRMIANTVSIVASLLLIYYISRPLIKF